MVTVKAVKQILGQSQILKKMHLVANFAEALAIKHAAN